MTFRIYDIIKSNFFDTLQYLRDLKAIWFDPQNIYFAQKAIRDTSGAYTKTNMQLSFIPLKNDQLVTDFLTLAFSSTDNYVYNPPANPLSLPTFPKDSTIAQFLNISPSDLLATLGPEGVILGVLNITNVRKPKVTPMTNVAPRTFIQKHSDGTNNTFTTDQMYKITYELDLNPTPFLLLSTNFGVSNYTAAHVGMVVPLGEYNAFNIVDGQLVWDVSKMNTDLANGSYMYYGFIDKGKKILAKLVPPQDDPTTTTTNAIIPQYLADGTPVNVQEVINTFKYQIFNIPSGHEAGYQFYLDSQQQSWTLPMAILVPTFIAFFL